MSFDRKTIQTLPQHPGIYIFKDAGGNILYIGKSRFLRDRVQSYFLKRNGLEPSKYVMVSQISSVETILTDTEAEALLLESTLIKKYRPPYNVILRDDKSYSYICIDETKPYPEISKIHRPDFLAHKTFFGPYTSAKAVYHTLSVIKKHFPVCLSPNNRQKKPCFNFLVKRCPGPCVKKISSEQYKKKFLPILRFLKGDISQFLKKLKKEIEHAAQNHQFEIAAQKKKLLLSLAAISEQQKVVGSPKESADYVSTVSFGLSACVNILLVRKGCVIDQKNFIVDSKNGFAASLATPLSTLPHYPLSLSDACLQALESYYSQTSDIPKKIYSHILSKKSFTTSSILFGHTITIPIINVRQGKRLGLLTLGEKNAQEYLFLHTASLEVSTPIEKLCQILRIPYHPGFRTEVFDVSTIGGYKPVGSMIVALDSNTQSREYRKFKLQAWGEPNDFEHMREMLSRRFKHTSSVIPAATGIQKTKNKKLKDSSGLHVTRYALRDFWPLPNLIVVDGGKGQLSIAKKVLKKYKLSIPLIALAKHDEKIFIPGKKEAIQLPKTNPALKFLQMVRDEAHRFGISFYRKRHRKALLFPQMKS